MEIRKRNDGMLTLCEVQQLVAQRTARRATPKRYFRRELQNRDEVEMQVQGYLDGSRVGKVSEEACFECCKALQELQFGLTEAEIVQLLDIAPMHTVEVHLVLEDCAARLDEWQVEQILATIQTHYFGGAEQQQEESQGDQQPEEQENGEQPIQAEDDEL